MQIHRRDVGVVAVKSAHRVLELLEYFADEQRGASVKEISQSLGYPQSSTSVLLKGLSQAGYFDHDPRTGLYEPNVRLSLITAWIEQRVFSEQGLLRVMQKLLDDSGHTVMIGKLEGCHVRYLHVLQSTRPGRFTAKIGSLRPLFRSAPGKMLLTTVLERNIPAILRRANSLESDLKLLSELSQVLRERKQSQKQQWAMSLGTSVPGAAGLAILLPVPPGHEPMTLSLGGPIAEIEPNKDALIEALNSAVAPRRHVLLRPRPILTVS